MRPLLLTVAVLVVVSISMTVVGLSIDVKATPTAAEAMKWTPPNPWGGWALIAAGVSWLMTFGAVVELGVRWVVKRKRPRSEEPR